MNRRHKIEPQAIPGIPKRLPLYFFLIFILSSAPAHAMHIMEGFLSISWCAVWWLASAPFLFLGMKSIRKTIKANPEAKILLSIAAAFLFVLSSLKLPSITGSSSHPTGVGLGAILFGPWVMTILGFIVLIFQALLLAHGGITTLGANTFSMGVVGPLASFLVFRGLKAARVPLWLCVFSAAALGDLVTYIVTAVQLALAYPDSVGGFTLSFCKFLTVFAFTQIPLAIVEGLLTVLVMKAIYSAGKDLINTPDFEL